MAEWIVRTNDFKSQPLVGGVTLSSKKQLAQPAFKSLALFWGLAILCLPIPGVHFILVPTFLIVGLVTFFKTFNKKNFISDGNYNCPVCLSGYRLKNWYFISGQKLRCHNCGESLVVTT